MAAPKFRASNTATASGGADISLTKPTGTIDNDILLAAVVVRGQTVAPPGGWSELYLDAASDFGIWWKRASSEGASYSFVTSGGSNPRAAAGIIASYKDCATDLFPSIGTVTKQTSTAVKGASVVTPAQAAIALHIGACASATNDVVTSTVPDGFRERDDVDDRDTSGTSVQCQVALSETYVLPYASTGDRNATLSSSKANWGALVILYQTPLSAGTSDGAGLETLVELTHWDEVAAAETVKKYSSRGVTFSGGEFYEARILDQVEISQQAVDRIAAGGLVATTVSVIELDNQDGALDVIGIANLAVGRSVIIKTVKVTQEALSDVGIGAVSNAVTAFTGIVAALRPIGTPSGTRMRLEVSDLTERLNVPLQAVLFDGTAGLGGGSELEGQTKPAAFGRLLNLLPIELGNFDLGDGSLYTFMINGRSIQNVTAVRERGVAMSEVGVAPIAGQYRQWLSSGVFQLGFTPNGVITANADGDDDPSFAETHGEVITRMVTEYGPQLTAGEIESTTFTDVDDALSGIVGGAMGIYFPTGDRSSTRDAVDRVLRSGGIWLSGGRNGKLRVALATPAPADRLSLKEPDIVALRPLPVPSSLQPAPQIVRMQRGKNWFPLTDISSSVTGATRRELAGPGGAATSTSALLVARQKPPREWLIPGLWSSGQDARLRGHQIRTWIELGLSVFEVTTDRYLNQVELGMACEIESYPRFGLNYGFAGIVAAWREAPGKGRVTLTLIGSKDTDAPELREAGNYELREDGTVELRESVVNALVGGGGGVGADDALDFTDADNSQYIPLLEDI